MNDPIRDVKGKGPIADYAGPRAFFKTCAGPGETEYPGFETTPNVYYAKRVINVRFDEEPGTRTLHYDETGHHACLFNLEPTKYIEEGAVVLCFREGGRWYTIDKVFDPKPCCKDYLFKPPTGGVTSFNLTMEALHGWFAYGEPANDFTLPVRTQESLSDPFTIPMTFQSPIPTEFMPEEGFFATGEISPGFFPYERELGWYISPSVTFMRIPGDPFFTGSSELVTGRWYFTSNCRVGFWFDEDFSISNEIYDKKWWMYYFDYMGEGLSGFDPDLQRRFFPHPSLSRSRLAVSFIPPVGPPPDFGTRTYRAYDLFSFEFMTCRPMLFQGRDFWQRHIRTGPDSPVLIGVPDPSPYWGVSVPLRLTEGWIDPPNPMALDLGGYSGAGSDPQHMIPPPEMEVFRGNRTVLEYFCLQFTATEAA